MNISKIFINKKTGNLIVVYYKYKNQNIIGGFPKGGLISLSVREAHIFNQHKKKIVLIDNDLRYTFVFYTNYIKAQLNQDWLQASKLTIYESENYKIRVFSFGDKYYKQVLHKYTITKLDSIWFVRISKVDYKDEILNRENKIINIATHKYISDYDLLPILKDL